MRCHNIAFDQDERVYVVDREADRIQIFDAEGNFLTMWNNIYRPDAMVCWQEHIYVGELNAVAGLEAAQVNCIRPTASRYTPRAAYT